VGMTDVVEAVVYVPAARSAQRPESVKRPLVCPTAPTTTTQQNCAAMTDVVALADNVETD